MAEKILLTGASSGIGKSIAQLLAENGFEVLATVRKEEDKTALEALNPSIKTFFADVTSENDLKKIKEEFLVQGIELYGIINNAGLAFTGIMECANIDELKAQFEINTFAPLRIVKEFLPLMKEGKIINISSVSSNVVYPFISPYCASKRAMDIFFQALDIELGNPKIKIISIKPASVKTPIWEKSNTAALERFEKLPENIQAKYRPTLEKLLKNSAKNTTCAIEVEVISKLVLKILNSKSPKSSYCVGLGSHIGAIMHKLPIKLQSGLAKFALKLMK